MPQICRFCELLQNTEQDLSALACYDGILLIALATMLAAIVCSCYSQPFEGLLAFGYLTYRTAILVAIQRAAILVAIRIQGSIGQLPCDGLRITES